MRLTITPTAEIRPVEGVTHVRIWTGTDEAGTRVRLLVLAVQPQTHDTRRLAPYDAALQEMPVLRETMTGDPAVDVEILRETVAEYGLALWSRRFGKTVMAQELRKDLPGDR